MASWSSFNGFVHLRSAVEIFSCCTKMQPAQKAASVCQFLNQKIVTSLYHPVLSSFISARLFFPQVENEVKRTPICGCCWDPRSRNWWIKEGPKRGIFCSFSKSVRQGKSLYIWQWSLFWIKKGICLRHVSSIFKKISPKTFGRHCVHYTTICFGSFKSPS